MDIYHSAMDLPDSWDKLTENPFLKKDILKIIERVNPCGQSYHILENSVFITYRLDIDIFTYSFARLKIPATVLGVPISISSAGFSRDLNPIILKHMDRIKGLKLILNGCEKSTTEDDSFPGGRTLPTSIFKSRWDDFDAYMDSLRSPYRYRINKALKKGQPLKRQNVPISDFDEIFYSLYTNVYENSDFKLERLPLNFFKEFPAIITGFYMDGKVVGFTQLYSHKDTLYFMFGGMDYEYIKSHDLYLNMLIDIIKYGIDGGYKIIELGQTAEDIKYKLGAVPLEKKIFFTHSNMAIGMIARVFPKLFTYSRKSAGFRVFRGQS